MTRSSRLAIASLLLSVACGLTAAYHAPQALGQDSKGFHPLFNGKDLTGWITPEDKSLFTVENGEIVGRTPKERLKKNEFLVTDKPYGDFVLKAKVKFRNGNSGIQFRSRRAANGVVSGPQADVADGYWGLLYEERGRGFLDDQREKAKSLVKKDDWNDFVITAKGSHVTIDFNGVRIIDREDPKFDKEGIIALQLHVVPEPMEVRFKDIEIQDLSK
jgi:Domain of Unknown Function (DUF1080)